MDRRHHPPAAYSVISLSNTVLFSMFRRYRIYRFTQLMLILLLPWLMTISLGGFHNRGRGDGLAHERSLVSFHSLLLARSFDMSVPLDLFHLWEDHVRRHSDIGQRSARLLTIQVLEHVDQRRLLRSASTVHLPADSSQSESRMSRDVCFPERNSHSNMTSDVIAIDQAG
jgi:hypothetical protein